MSRGRLSLRKWVKRALARPCELLENRRLLSAGAPDLTYGTQGAAMTSFAAPHDFASPAAVLVQHDGEAIVVGTAGPSQQSGTPNNDFALARYTTAGKLDTTFGTQGAVFTDFNGGDDMATAAALQSDGKIVVAGTSNYTGNGSDFVLARYTPSGALDTSFGNQGRVLTNLASIGGMQATALAIDSAGRILVLGDSGDPSDPDKFALARYQPNGALDPTFGTGGISVFTAGPSIVFSDALAIAPDGKIVVAGGTTSGNFYATRLTATGALDTSFGTGGLTQVDFGFLDRAVAVDFVAGGKIVLGGTGSVSNGTAGVFELTRLNSNGTLDTTFGTSGKTTTSFGQIASAHAMTVQLDGKILLTGAGSPPNSTNDSLLARYTANGKLDTTFNGNGEVLFDTVNDSTQIGFSAAFGVAVQTDGKVLAAGEVGHATQNSSTAEFVLARFDGDAPGSVSGKVFNDTNGNGTLNSGETGIAGRQVYLDVNNNGVFDAADYYVTTDASGNFTFANLAPGTYQFREVLPQGSQITGPSGGTFTVTLTAGLNVTGKNFGNNLIPAGLIDVTYGTQGSVVTPFNAPHDEANPVALLLQHDGKAIAVGGAISGDTGPGSPTPPAFVLARYTTAGTLDASFGAHGVVVTDFGGIGATATGAALQSDGKIVVAGVADDNDLAIARFTTSGALDTTFGNHGLVATDLGFVSAEANAVAIDSAGRIIVAGVTTTSNSVQEFTVARFNSNGTIDTTFGHAGIARFTSGNLQSPSVHSVVIQSNGNIVVAGLTFSGNFLAVRLTSGGALDGTFGTGGVATVNFGAGSVASASAAAIVAGGKIVLGGTEITPSNNGLFALARLNANGTLDTTFGTGGKTTTGFGPSSASANGMTVQLDGKILLAGSLEDDNIFTNSSALARYTANGKLDTTFNGNGEAVFDTAVSGGAFAITNAFAVAVQTDGNILVAGDMGQAHAGGVFDDFVLTRFTGDAPGSISGQVFNDANGNGAFDPGETGLGSRQVYLDMNNDGVFDAGDYYVTTDTHGNYTFANLAVGTYVVREVVPAGSHSTTPAGGAFTVTLTPGLNVTSKNFGNKT